jgi:hypothetical protein
VLYENDQMRDGVLLDSVGGHIAVSVSCTYSCSVSLRQIITDYSEACDRGLLDEMTPVCWGHWFIL